MKYICYYFKERKRLCLSDSSQGQFQKSQDTYTYF